MRKEIHRGPFCIKDTDGRLNGRSYHFLIICFFIFVFVSTLREWMDGWIELSKLMLEGGRWKVEE